jgi:hypothetical protein
VDVTAHLSHSMLGFVHRLLLCNPIIFLPTNAQPTLSYKPSTLPFDISNIESNMTEVTGLDRGSVYK